MFPGLAVQLALTTALVAFLYLLGAAALSFARLPGRSWNYPLFCFPAGLVLSVGLFSFFSYGRPTYLLASPIALAVWLLVQRREDPGTYNGLPRIGLVQLCLFCLPPIFLSVVFCRFWYGGAAPDGMVALPFKDWGFFGMLVQQIVPSGHMSVWSGAVGEHLSGTSHAHDIWYHWGFIWLGALVREFTGLTAWVSLSAVAVPATMAVSVISAAFVIAQITSWSLWKSLIPALFSVFFVGLGPSTLLQPKLVDLFGLTGVLYCNGPFVLIPWIPFECGLFFSAVWAWLSGRFSWCFACIFFAAASAPHTFIVLSAALGLLLVAGFFVRDGLQVRAAVLGLSAVLMAWFAVNVIFGAATSKPSHMVSEPPALIPTAWHVASRGTIDALVAVALLALAVPGLLRLAASGGEEGERRTRILGLFALSALIAGGFGFRLLESLGFGSIDAIIMPGISRNIVVLPIAAFGTALLSASRNKLLAFVSFAVFAAVGLVGVYDLPKRHRALLNEEPVSAGQVAELSRRLEGGKFGYFASSDRNWWIPVHASMAAVAGGTCIRLNPLPVDDDWAGKQYGSDIPAQIVADRGGGPTEEWSANLAHALGIKHLLTGPKYEMPESWRGRLTQVAEVGDYRIWEVKHSAPNHVRTTGH